MAGIALRRVPHERFGPAEAGNGLIFRNKFFWGLRLAGITSFGRESRPNVLDLWKRALYWFSKI
jgi:hypothetical protein